MVAGVKPPDRRQNNHLAPAGRPRRSPHRGSKVIYFDVNRGVPQSLHPRLPSVAAPRLQRPQRSAPQSLRVAANQIQSLSLEHHFSTDENLLAPRVADLFYRARENVLVQHDEIREFVDF